MEVLCKVQSAIFISLTNFTISPYMFLANRGHGHAVPRSGGRRGWSVYCINMWARRGACVVTDSLVTLRTEGGREGGRMREDTEAAQKLERAEGEGGGGEAGDRNRDEGVCNGTFLDGFR